MKSYDFLIIGAGINGLAIAWELRQRDPKASIAILEKEREIASHASGRNSGVLHAGFYYQENSLKAKFTASGNRLMKEFCEEHGLPIDPCGKVVVAQSASDLLTLEKLYQRGINNHIELTKVTEKELHEIEPNARTYQYALYSPSTAIVDPKSVCHKLKELLQEQNVDIHLGEKVVQCTPKKVTTSAQTYYYGHLINCAGLYADKLARHFDLAHCYAMLPFKGVYLKNPTNPNKIHKHIYPVPQLENPFLGVHFTKTINNEIKIGPTAIPALWYEQYQGLKNISFSEVLKTTYYLVRMFLLNKNNIRSSAYCELKKYKKRTLIKCANSLVKKTENHFDSNPAGIRAQLINTMTLELVMDFIIEHSKSSTHVLNAVSPGFTCAFSFSKHLADEIEKYL